MAAAAQAFAGGDDYDAANDVKGAGPAYFGFVRDNRGSPLVDAQVVLQPKKGKTVSLKSNALGLYRGHISKDVRPDDVQISRTVLVAEAVVAGSTPDLTEAVRADVARRMGACSRCAPLTSSLVLRHGARLVLWGGLGAAALALSARWPRSRATTR